MPKSGVGAEFPILKTPHSPSEVLRRLSVVARRGRLAGFSEHPRTGLFTVAAFGETFDYRLVAFATPEGTGCEISFTLDLIMRAPLIMGFVILLTIWPGVWLTESMLSTYSDWYARLPTWVTYAWYMPVTVLPIPWMWKRMHGKSRAAAVSHAREQIEKIAAEIDVVPAGPKPS